MNNHNKSGNILAEFQGNIHVRVTTNILGRCVLPSVLILFLVNLCYVCFQIHYFVAAYRSGIFLLTLVVAATASMIYNKHLDSGGSPKNVFDLFAHFREVLDFCQAGRSISPEITIIIQCKKETELSAYRENSRERQDCFAEFI